MSISLRPPLAGEMEFLRAWLPFAMVAPGSLLGLVAVDQQSGKCLGGVTLNALQVASQPMGGLALFVLPECRRQGIGTTLLRGAFRLAHETGMQRVATLDLVEDGSALHTFCRHHGMLEVDILFTYELPLAETLRGLETKYELLHELARRDYGPTITDVHWLAEVEPTTVHAFIQRYGRSAIGAPMARLTSPAYLSTSTVLREANEITGLLLAGVDGETSYLDLLLVADHRRQTTAELVLLLAAARKASELGVTRVIFDASPDAHPFPVRLGRRLHARQISRRMTMAIDREQLASAAGPAAWA